MISQRATEASIGGTSSSPGRNFRSFPSSLGPRRNRLNGKFFNYGNNEIVTTLSSFNRAIARSWKKGQLPLGWRRTLLFYPIIRRISFLFSISFSPPPREMKDSKFFVKFSRQFRERFFTKTVRDLKPKRDTWVCSCLAWRLWISVNFKILHFCTLVIVTRVNKHHAQRQQSSKVVSLKVG